MRLLVVDHTSDITQLPVVPFHQAGVNTVAADDGGAAIALSRCASPDLIILDRDLPDMDGLDACRAIRQITAAPIVVLSQAHTEPARLQALAAGASDRATNPFDADSLHATVRELLRAGSSRRHHEPQDRSDGL